MEELQGSDYERQKGKESLFQSPDDVDQVFEITDFTTATDWERFIADFEDVLRKWDKNNLEQSDKVDEKPEMICGSIAGGIADCLNHCETVSLKFAKFVLIVRLYCYKGSLPPLDRPINKLMYTNRSDELKDYLTKDVDLESDETKYPVFSDLMDFRYSFPHRAHCIYRWFGVKKFIVISPMENNLITSEDRAKLLLSSASIAMRNINVYIPVFVQIHHPQRKFFHGILEGSTSRIMFDMILFREAPESYHYLSELTKIFREKIASPFLSTVSIELSVRFTHILNKWPQEWILPESEPTNLEERLCSLDKLPMTLIEYSSSPAPIDEIHLSTTWPKLIEDMVNDSPNHSNLNSMDAPYWSVRALFQDRYIPALVHTISSLFILAKTSKQADQPLGKYSGLQEDKVETEARAALDRLAGVGPPTLTLPQFRSVSTIILSEELKCHLIEFIFSQQSEINEPINGLLKDYRSFKSSPYNNLTWRLSIIFHQFKDLTTIAYLWTEIVKKLRDLWENLIDLPSLEIVSPDLSTCLLNQKLQMLNCCIQQKRKREMISKTDSGRKLITRNDNLDDNNSEDEFFDAIEDEGEFNQGDKGSSVQPEGRSHQLNDFTLISKGEPLYVPITQDPAPMTEDMMMEQVQILAQLGTSSEGAALRARMQSAQLISDMEAFKSANPGSMLEDFVRWHSPRDFILEDDDQSSSSALPVPPPPRGKLSARMETPGNMWREVWESAKPVPVARQKLLFDYTKEAEKILHSFSSLTCNGLINYLAPCLIHSATSQLIKRIETLGFTESELAVNLTELTRNCSSGDYDKCLIMLGNLETRLVKIETLKRLFKMAAELSSSSSTTDDETKDAISLSPTSSTWNTVNPLILGLTQDKEMEIAGGSKGILGRLLVKLFTESDQAVYEEQTTVGERTSRVYDKSDLPPPLAKEYVLRATCPRPSITSKPLPQRMFALITPNEFRVSGAFCQDTLFR